MAADGVAVPGVRQVDGSGVVAGVAVAEETPVTVDVDHFTSLGLRASCYESHQKQCQSEHAFHRESHKKRYWIIRSTDFDSRVMRLKTV